MRWKKRRRKMKWGRFSEHPVKDLWALNLKGLWSGGGESKNATGLFAS